MKYRTVVIFISVVLTGCNPASTVDAMPDAKELASAFFDGFTPEKFESTFLLYRNEFWDEMPRETWAKILPKVYDKLGSIQNCELQTWSQSTRMTVSGSGNFVSLVYACKHTKYESVISFTVVKPLTGGESKILNQNFNSR